MLPLFKYLLITCHCLVWVPFLIYFRYQHNVHGVIISYHNVIVIVDFFILCFIRLTVGLWVFGILSGQIMSTFSIWELSIAVETLIGSVLCSVNDYWKINRQWAENDLIYFFSHFSLGLPWLNRDYLEWNFSSFGSVMEIIYVL